MGKGVEVIHTRRVPTIDGLRVDEAHKGGNPIKSITKTVKKAASQVSSEASRASSQLTKAGTAALATATDPGVWLGYAINPTGGGFMAASEATKTYEALGTAEKDKFRAEAEQRMALDKERKAMAEQEKMVSDKAKAAAASAKERAARMGTGRRGLLFQGKESGVTGLSKTLGG